MFRPLRSTSLAPQIIIIRAFVMAIALGLLIVNSHTTAAAAPAAIRYVSTSGNDFGNGTCAQATPCRTIAYSINVAVAGDTIDIGTGTFNEIPMNLSKNLTLIGDGVRNTIVDVNAQGSVFTIQPGITAEIRKMRIRDGKAKSPDQGGGIRNLGTLKLKNVTLSDNQAQSGGAIFNQGSLVVTKSTLYHNTANGNGGGLYNHKAGSAVFTQVNVQLNQANLGGGIANYGTFLMLHGAVHGTTDGGAIANGDHVGLLNVTISGNANPGTAGAGLAMLGGTAYLNYVTIAANSGRAIFANSGSVVLSNSIVHGNSAPQQCAAGSIGVYSDGGYNVLADQSCGYWPGTGSILTNPKLKPLDYNGGFTPTQALKPASPAIDLVPPNKCTSIDQRGVARPVEGDGVGKAKCDGGAFEYEP